MFKNGMGEDAKLMLNLWSNPDQFPALLNERKTVFSMKQDERDTAKRVHIRRNWRIIHGYAQL